MLKMSYQLWVTSKYVENWHHCFITFQFIKLPEEWTFIITLLVLSHQKYFENLFTLILFSPKYHVLSSWVLDNKKTFMAVLLWYYCITKRVEAQKNIYLKITNRGTNLSNRSPNVTKHEVLKFNTNCDESLFIALTVRKISFGRKVAPPQRLVYSWSAPD